MNLKFELETVCLYFIHRILRKDPKIWLTSDSHYGHKGVVIYCRRPFTSKSNLDAANKIERGNGPGAFESARKCIPDKDVNYMDKALVRRWNAMVNHFDTVYHLGDFAMSKKKTLEYISKLNGFKKLVPGNHCLVWKQNGLNKYGPEYRKYGWDILDKIVTVELSGYKLKLSHLPYADEEGKEYDVRYWEERPKKEDEDMLIHGHCHTKYLKKSDKIDVGIDNNFRLYSLEDIIKLIEDKRDFIPARLTGNKSVHGESM